MNSKLTVNNNLSYLPISKSFIQSMLDTTVFNSDMKSKILLVSEEAFCHLVETAYEPDEIGEITISVNTESNFSISFFDKGLPFDPSLIKEYNPDDNLTDDIEKESLGIFLIKEIADEVSWINLGKKGKELKIIFNYPEKDITETLDKEDLALFKGNEPRIKSSFYDTHRARDNEFIQVSRCIYKCYGYTYPNEDLYFPDRIKEYNEKDILISVVVTDDKNNVVGHYALERYDLGVIAECGQAVISPEHRGNDLFTKLRDFLEKEAKKLNLHGIYSQSVTTHTLSQKVNIKFQSKPFGIMLGLVPGTLKLKKMKTNISDQRVSCVYFYKAFVKPENKTYYIPDKYHKLVDFIFDNAGLEQPRYIPNSEIGDQKGRIEYKFYPSWEFGFIKVYSIGENIIDLIKQAFMYLTMKAGAKVVYLDLPMEEKGSDILINAAKEIGFIFAAVALSALNGKDSFRMQYINCQLDLSVIQIVEDFNIIYDFIKNEFSNSSQKLINV